MATMAKDNSSILLEKIAQQQATVAALKGDGHVYADAERQLTEMMEELARHKSGHPRAA
jgi:hypothetical protein